MKDIKSGNNKHKIWDGYSTKCKTEPEKEQEPYNKTQI